MIYYSIHRVNNVSPISQEEKRNQSDKRFIFDGKVTERVLIQTAAT